MSFRARYRGECVACDDAITPGQEVEFTDNNDLVHVLCPEDLNQVTGKPRPVCGSCFLTIPAGHSVCPECNP